MKKKDMIFQRTRDYKPDNMVPVIALIADKMLIGLPNLLTQDYEQL